MFDLCPGVTCLRGTRSSPREVYAHDAFEVRAGGVDVATRRVTAYASTGAMDSYETVFEPRAFKKWLPRYMKNPIVLGQHTRWLDSGEPPVIGKTVEAEVDDKGLKVVIEFAQGGVADLWWERYAKGFMRGFSQSSQILKSEWRDRADGTGRYLVFTEVRLREISCVDIPSCDEALVRAYGRRAARGPADATDAPGAMDAVQAPARGLPARTLEERVLDIERQLPAGDDAHDLRERVRALRADVDALLARRTPAKGPTPGATPGPNPTTERTETRKPRFAGMW